MSEKIKGIVGGVSAKIVRGWAFDTTSTKPIEVQLFVDGKMVSKQTASLDRPFLLKSKKHATGKCGFKFDFDDKNKLDVKKKIEVKVGSTVLKKRKNNKAAGKKNAKKKAGVKAKAKSAKAS